QRFVRRVCCPMTSPEAIPSIDFTAPRRVTGQAGRALADWHRSASVLMKENWQGLLGSSFELSCESLDSCEGQRAVRMLPDPGYGARLAVGPSRFPVLVAFSGRIVQALVADMLGTLGEEWPELKPLSAAEGSMVELLFGEVARSLSQAWPDIAPLECELESVIVRPMRSRIFHPDELLFRATNSIRMPQGTDEAVWLFPQEGLQAIGMAEAQQADLPPEVSAPRLRELAHRLPMTMVVRLGTATVSLADMNRLSVGDILILDQPVGRPLPASISGKVRWYGQPCRLGMRQGFRVVRADEEYDPH
ncbi:MAG: FliM/FliN family flagellar motor switch protein, partial [Planctomycetaceae bacterium]|nr:FliM/FliN family flagellar motor switch protein [Planctomycetaceae bacterium]